ncbi:MAG: integrase [Candidatus Bathyarchaeia archaeon]|uniref:integrase n=1 Tax=Candidatus Hadarchaeum sp. TaxID=2883567 RepID=UPI00317B6314
MGTWDKGLDLEETLQLLQEKLKIADGAEYTYLAVLFTQAINGSRVGEALTAVQNFVETDQREQRVRIEKRKDGAERLIIIPSIIERSRLTPEALSLPRIKQYARRKLRINTHSLRYAWITAQVKKNINPGIIASITGHKNLNMLINYIQKKQAEEYLRQQSR